MPTMKCSQLLTFLLAVLLACASAGFAAENGGSREELLKRYDFDKYGRQPISFLYCQAGFHPNGYKPVYVWTREEFTQGTALLRNCATGRTTSVPLTSHGINIWGRQDWIADCSSVNAEGDYTLRVSWSTRS